MGIIQLMIFVVFILLYVAILGVLLFRLTARNATGLYNRDEGQDQEVALGG